ncbi:diguanylate cyclase (GGDEF) domain-containing protein [Methylobacterium sp. UNC378MF]|uniref:putative bifunctional diguanylate cyclase/phosphodiesterase n=1 Tax=Methylobacterium sp. UNC378MF TaxID=1502748 RepID=UPI0008832E86|nr:EAL domain-containing protein [Methylobacterium sp. UNC378MF]SDA34760.1 diguanylate cyclase (GGDEF) domain-containing protein [Methylobacterium sp. UNC378MF]
MKRPEHPLSILIATLTTSARGLTAVRQLTELQKQVPTLYGLLSVNAGALAVTHYGLAPAVLTLGIPGAVIALCLVRAVHWLRLRPETLSEAQAARHLRRTTVLTVFFSVAFVIWAMVLNRFGGPYEQGHVAIFVAVTVIACIFCLTHLPVAAFLVTGIVMGVFLFCCVTSGNNVFLAIAVNTAFVTAVMVRILNTNYRAFVDLVASQAMASELSEENARLAQTDSLTGLPNRRYFFQQLDAAIRSPSDADPPFALAIFDLDRFKPINDTYGHNVGDRVLAEAGRRLAGFASAEVVVTRLGGDEFGVLLRAPDSAAAALTVCDGICTALQQPIWIGDIQVVTGCSGGLALPCRITHDADALFDRADYALYHSKEQRRGATTLFSQEHKDAIRAEQAVETALRTADLAAEMGLHYQPILDTATGRIALVEGLARWTNPSLGSVPPDRFIAAAERCGMIHTVTLLLLRKALADCAQLPPGTGLSFNLSAHDLASPETVLAILAAVQGSGLDPRRLTLELTETALMRDFDHAKAAITTLRSLGIKIALDDFGTGYSSLGYVHRLPLDKIKIDRSFIADIETDRGRSLVSTILDLCRNLGLDGIVEGIETQAQLDVVRRHGSRYVQGYHIGRPMPLADLLRRLERDAVAVRRRA